MTDGGGHRICGCNWMSTRQPGAAQRGSGWPRSRQKGLVVACPGAATCRTSMPRRTALACTHPAPSPTSRASVWPLAGVVAFVPNPRSKPSPHHHHHHQHHCRHGCVALTSTSSATPRPPGCLQAAYSQSSQEADVTVVRRRGADGRAEVGGCGPCAAGHNGMLRRARTRVCMPPACCHLNRMGHAQRLQARRAACTEGTTGREAVPQVQRAGGRPRSLRAPGALSRPHACMHARTMMHAHGTWHMGHGTWHMAHGPWHMDHGWNVPAVAVAAAGRALTRSSNRPPAFAGVALNPASPTLVAGLDCHCTAGVPPWNRWST